MFTKDELVLLVRMLYDKFIESNDTRYFEMLQKSRERLQQLEAEDKKLYYESLRIDLEAE